MDITTFADASPPLAGSTTPGDLYVDLQSRAMWLGVDESVDPNGSVLLSDILAEAEAIADAIAECKAYTDAGIATRAPLSHTHTASQITDFTAAVTSVATSIPQLNWVRGQIILWWGNIVEIGVGNLAGWAICDGRSYNIGGTNVKTPDLRDRFVIGAGNKLPNAINTITSFVTDTQGAHTHTNNGTTLTIAMIPAHGHPFSDSSSSTSSAGSHQHLFDEYYNVSSGTNVEFHSPGYVPASPNLATVQRATVAAGVHAHTVAVSGTTSNVGGGGSHTHTMTTAGSHAHTIKGTDIRDVTPFYALAYIMKL
jgi:Phage Tail Collar Domain